MASNQIKLKLIVNLVKLNKLQRKSTGIIFLDVEKAFDTVSSISLKTSDIRCIFKKSLKTFWIIENLWWKLMQRVHPLGKL